MNANKTNEAYKISKKNVNLSFWDNITFDVENPKLSGKLQKKKSVRGYEKILEVSYIKCRKFNGDSFYLDNKVYRNKQK